jgi:hypothetical protein
MNGENRETIQELLSILRDKKAILFAGAGCSKISDYPLWFELIDDMRKTLIPSLTLPPNIDYTVCADQIKDQLSRMGLEKDYFKYLERTFQPEPSKNHTPFHCALVQLGFSGIVSTNYDILLESAVDESFAAKDAFQRCDSIDLCLKEPYMYRVFEFLRKISPSNNHPGILHIHGWYKNPREIILTRKDYQRAYGELSGDLAEEKQKRPLDTIHRKVIWSLLTMHPILFVGFSMDDEFFMKMLEIVQDDFDLGRDPVHYAIMGYQSETKRDMMFDKLKSKGITTIFYQIVNRGTSSDQNHDGLIRLVFELADELNIHVGAPDLRTLNKKMLER